MLFGWWDLIRHPRTPRPRAGDDSVIVCRPSKRISFGAELLSENNTPRGAEKLPEGGRNEKEVSVPEPGDVTKRHKTTNLFEDSDEEDEKKKKPMREEDIV